MLTVSQQFTFINNTAWDLEVRLLAVPEGTCEVQLSDFEYSLNSSVVPHSSEDNRKQLLVWQMIGHASSHLIFYIMLKLAASKQMAVNCEGCAFAWSVPVRVPWTREGSHCMVAVPRHQEDLCCSVAVSMTCHKDSSGLYIMLTPDNAPMCILHNLCPFVLQFGQGLDKHLCSVPGNYLLSLSHFFVCIFSPCFCFLCLSIICLLSPIATLKFFLFCNE